MTESSGLSFSPALAPSPSRREYTAGGSWQDLNWKPVLPCLSDSSRFSYIKPLVQGTKQNQNKEFFSFSAFRELLEFRKILRQCEFSSSSYQGEDLVKSCSWGNQDFALSLHPSSNCAHTLCRLSLQTPSCPLLRESVLSLPDPLCLGQKPVVPRNWGHSPSSTTEWWSGINAQPLRPQNWSQDPMGSCWQHILTGLHPFSS